MQPRFEQFIRGRQYLPKGQTAKLEWCKAQFHTDAPTEDELNRVFHTHRTS